MLSDRLVRRRKVRQARRPPRQARRGAVADARRPRQDAAQRRVPAETYGHGQHRVDVLDRRFPDDERPSHLGHVRRLAVPGHRADDGVRIPARRLVRRRRRLPAHVHVQLPPAGKQGRRRSLHKLRGPSGRDFGPDTARRGPVRELVVRHDAAAGEQRQPHLRRPRLRSLPIVRASLYARAGGRARDLDRGPLGVRRRSIVGVGGHGRRRGGAVSGLERGERPRHRDRRRRRESAETFRRAGVDRRPDGPHDQRGGTGGHGLVRRGGEPGPVHRLDADRGPRLSL